MPSCANWVDLTSGEGATSPDWRPSPYCLCAYLQSSALLGHLFSSHLMQISFLSAVFFLSFGVEVVLPLAPLLEALCSGVGCLSLL